MRVACLALFLAVGVSPAFAQREPNIVIPGKPGVPVIINGIDASWGMVVGEFGLDRPGVMAPVVVYQPLLVDVPYAVPGYFPRSGRKPGYGRLEIQPAGPPRPAPTYFRNWSSESAPLPPTIYPEYPMPPVIVEPNFGRRHDHGHGDNGKGPHHAEP